jgi:hypothetical protein
MDFAALRIQNTYKPIEMPELGISGFREEFKAKSAQMSIFGLKNRGFFVLVT